MLIRVVAALSLGLALSQPALAQSATEPITVFAAGSLRAALSDVARAFEKKEIGVQVRLTLGPSGLLKDRIVAGEPAHVFASANMTHPEALRESGKADVVRPFARNALCALGSVDFNLKGKTLVQRLLDADVRVGISTPKADPSGDYAFLMFERIESTGAGGPGSADALKAKAVQLTGGPNSPTPPPGRSLYGLLVEEGKADVFITYCTNVAEARQQSPSLQLVQVPDAVNVHANYGLALLNQQTPAAKAFAEFVLGTEGQNILAGHGFKAP